MTTEDNIAATHQPLGEIEIGFQWVENLYRQIGWFILDPNRKQWPAMQLRRETNAQLIDKVTDMWVDLTKSYNFGNGNAKADDIA